MKWTDTKTTLVVWTLIALAGWFVLKQATSKENKQDINLSGNAKATIIQGEQRGWFNPFTKIYGQYDTDNEIKGVVECGIKFGH